MPPSATKYDYQTLRREYIEAEPKISLSDLARRHGIPDTKHSTIHRRAMVEGWEDMREKRIAKTDDKVIEALSERQARRQLRRMEVEDNAIDAIDEAISKMRSDMTRTKKEQDPETKEWHEVPLVTYRPEQVVQLMDRIKGLFEGTVVPEAAPPAAAPNLTQINFGSFDGTNPEHRALAAAVVGATRPTGRPARGAPGESPLPDAPGFGEDQQP